MMKLHLAIALAGLLATAAPALAAEAIPTPVRAAAELRKVAIPEANQAVAVDAQHYYAIDNRTIAKYRKDSNERVGLWEGPEGGPILHLDSGTVIDGRLYAAHSNYPDSPMVGSVEVFDVATMDHVDSHSFGIDRGSFTWVDRDAQGRWWGTFANYNRVFGREMEAYGNKYRTQLVRFRADWSVEEAFVLPDAVLERFEDMSNSGGSFGPDGNLYISGHDPAELYMLREPAMGSVMEWVETVTLDITGQGFAWDRAAAQPTVWGIIRGEGDEGNFVTEHRVRWHGSTRDTQGCGRRC